MKQKNLRFIAALLSFALFVSVLAVPASAATKNTWITSVANQRQSTTLWLTATAVEELEAASSAQLAYIKYCLEEQGGTCAGTEYLYEDYQACEIDANAYAGLSKVGGSKIYWYTRDDFKAWKTELKKSDTQIDWDTGEITLAVGADDARVLSPCAQGARNRGGGAFGLDVAGVTVQGKTALLLAGGAAVFVVAAKLYDDPAILDRAKQKVQGFFGGIADTVQGWFAPDAPAEETAASKDAQALAAE